MKQEAFEVRYADQWRLFEEWLDAQEEKGKKKHKSVRLDESRLPKHYRNICHHLSLSRQRHYSPTLRQHLNRLALRGHKHFYRAQTTFWGGALRFFGQTFPGSVRRYWKFVSVSATLFFVPLIVLIVLIQYKPTLVYSVMDPVTAATVESMYEDDVERLGLQRQADSDFLMFGHYVYNNVSIGFRTFASGMLYGVGTILILLYNGTFIGAVAGHVTHLGYGENFWSFVVGHGAFELTAIVLAGAAGLLIGYSLWAPGPRTRVESLRHATKEALPLILGAAAMFLIAAVIEAFWSASIAFAPEVKYAVAAVFWLIVFLYFGTLGKVRGS